MINLIKINSQEKKQEENNIYENLTQFYQSFFSNLYNECNIKKYRQIRDAIGLVMRKFESNDHPLAYTSKLVMYIEARVTIYRLHLTNEQQKLLSALGEESKHMNLNFVYTSPIDDLNQFN